MSTTCKTVILNGKTSDLGQVILLDANKQVINECEGYIPYALAWIGGDYITLRIDNETGVIQNWKPIKGISEDGSSVDFA